MELFPAGRCSVGQSGILSLGIPIFTLPEPLGMEFFPLESYFVGQSGILSLGIPIFSLPKPLGMEFFPSRSYFVGQSGILSLEIPIFTLPKPLGMEFFPSRSILRDNLGYYPSGSPFSPSPSPWGWNCSRRGGILGDNPNYSSGSPSPSSLWDGILPLGELFWEQSRILSPEIPIFTLPEPLGMGFFPSGRYFGDNLGHYDTFPPFSSTPPFSLPSPSPGMMPGFPSRGSAGFPWKGREGKGSQGSPALQLPVRGFIPEEYRPIHGNDPRLPPGGSKRGISCPPREGFSGIAAEFLPLEGEIKAGTELGTASAPSGGIPVPWDFGNIWDCPLGAGRG
ncbi:uncharacterized protein LOC127465419 [Manacus candei]|uniref:uncharacterized protein LOC127465419 n=1 Tax=Manacus candei TaxID=415023 RepID=UPI00222621B6|nr:uncharacterized protein LOC127465419 [Manacus candei]